jgi:hypothetical protein
MIAVIIGITTKTAGMTAAKTIRIAAEPAGVFRWARERTPSRETTARAVSATPAMQR